MASSIQTDADGTVISETVTQNQWTIQVSRKVGRPNYGSEEMSIFAQMPIDHDAKSADVDKKIKATAAFLKTLIFNQLGLESTLDDNGIVREVEAEVEKPAAAKPAAPAKKAAAPAKKAAGGQAAAEKADLWREWVDSPDHFWDNRPEVTGKPKPNPRGPDFKHRESGKGLWIDEKTPAYARLVLDGAAEVVEDDEPF